MKRQLRPLHRPVTVMGLGVLHVLHITAQVSCNAVEVSLSLCGIRSLLMNQLLPPASLCLVCQQWPCNCIQSPPQLTLCSQLTSDLIKTLSVFISVTPLFSISCRSPLNLLWHCVLWRNFMSFSLSFVIIFSVVSPQLNKNLILATPVASFVFLLPGQAHTL